MNFFDISFWQSFISSLTATLIGVALGIPAALWINRFIEEGTEKEKKKIKKVLLEEMTENLDSLEYWKGKDCDFSKIRSHRQVIIPLCVDLYTESWEAFSNGGELEWIKTPIVLDTLATSYNKISGVKFLAKQYLDLAYSDSKLVDQETVEYIGSKLSEKIVDAIRTIDATREIIEFEYKKI